MTMIKTLLNITPSFCDARIIWGGDDTINEIRNFKLKRKGGEI